MLRWLDEYPSFSEEYRKIHKVHKSRQKKGKLSIKMQTAIVAEKYFNVDPMPQHILLYNCWVTLMQWDELPLPMQFKYKEAAELFLKSISLESYSERLFYISLENDYPAVKELIKDKKCILLTVNECFKYIQDNLHTMPEDYLERNAKFIRKLGNKTLSQSLVISFISDFGFKEVMKNSNVYGKYL